MLFSATWRQKSQKIDFMNVFHGFIGFGSETANLFNTCRAQGENNPPIYCQHLQGMLATFNINTCRDQKPHIGRPLRRSEFLQRCER